MFLEAINLAIKSASAERPEKLGAAKREFLWRSPPTRLAESITGHYSGGSEFNNYGTVGYTLEQKLEALNRIAV